LAECGKPAGVVGEARLVLGAGGTEQADFACCTMDIPLYYYGVPAMGAMAFGVLGLVTAGRSLGRSTAGWWLGSAVSLLILPTAAGPLPVVR
jgi:hypothetical protein